MRNIAGLVAGQDAREDESRDPRLLRGFDEVPIPEVVHFFQRVALSAARVSRCGGDDSIGAAHGSLQRRRLEHVPSRDFHTFRRETARVRSLADERADAFPALQERVHHSTNRARFSRDWFQSCMADSTGIVFGSPSCTIFTSVPPGTSRNVTVTLISPCISGSSLSNLSV